jgi:hypothetical protein
MACTAFKTAQVQLPKFTTDNNDEHGMRPEHGTGTPCPAPHAAAALQHSMPLPAPVNLAGNLVNTPMGPMLIAYAQREAHSACWCTQTM